MVHKFGPNWLAEIVCRHMGVPVMYSNPKDMMELFKQIHPNVLGLIIQKTDESSPTDQGRVDAYTITEVITSSMAVGAFAGSEIVSDGISSGTGSCRQYAWDAYKAALNETEALQGR